MTTTILRGTPATAVFQVFKDGTLVDFDSTPAAAAVDAAGAVVTLGSLTNPSSGTYHVEIDGQTELKIITVTLTGNIATAATVLSNRYEIVGGFIFTENQARTFAAKADTASVLVPLASETEYPDSVIGAERDRITAQFEEWTARSWVPRYGRAVGPGSGGVHLDVADLRRTHGGAGYRRDVRTVLSVTIGGATVDVADVEIGAGGYLFYSGGWSSSSTSLNNVVVEYEYGVDAPTGGVDRVGLLLAVQRLMPSAIAPSALSTTGDFGTTRHLLEGGPMHNRTRIAEVNEWLSFNNRHLGFA